MTNNLERISTLFSEARERVYIISAFVNSDVLSKLLSASKNAVERAVYVRWEIEDVASGASDWRAWDVAKTNNVPMYACTALHTKLYVADDRVIFGSANATKPGLEGGQQSNLELLVETNDSMCEISSLISKVQNIAVEAMPLGSDIQYTIKTDETGDSSSDSNLFLPRSDPRIFLDAMKGTRLHTQDTDVDRTALKLNHRTYTRHEIVRALKKMTVFRIVRHEFEERVHPMNMEELHKHIKKCAPTLSKETTLTLAQWLGLFGENTHLSPSSPHTDPLLYPGTLLKTD